MENGVTVRKPAISQTAVMEFARAACRVAVCVVAFAAVWTPAQEPVNEVMERGRNFFSGGGGDNAAPASSETAKRDSKDAGGQQAAAQAQQQQVEAVVKRGVDYYENKAFAKAVAEFTEAIRLKPDAAHLYNLRGTAYDEMGEYDKAIADYDEAIRLDPKSTIYPNNKNIALQKKAQQLAAAEAARLAAAEATRLAAEQLAAEAARLAAEQLAARDKKAAVAYAPPAVSGGLSFEYRPVGRHSSSGIVYFYRHGKRIEPATLRVFDLQGRLLKRISISDRGQDSRDGRTVGSWDLTDMNNRQVRYGTYKVTGTIDTRDGKSEEISLTLDLR
jgi:tetratricopeptide (TPR) repeat protein